MALTYRGTKGSPLTIAEIDSNFAYFTGSHSITGSLTISGSLYTTEPLLITGSLLPVDSGVTALGDPELYFGELYLSTASVNFMGQPGTQVASIKAWGEGAASSSPETASGMVYIAPFYYSGSSLVQKSLRGSFGVGTGSYAIGTGSVVLGRNLLAFGNHQTVVGAFNQTSSANSSFIIGNGTSTGSKSNLLFASASQVQITGSLIISGTAALSGDVSFTTSGSGVIQTVTEFTPTGTASYGSTLDNVSTSTTTYLQYGINIVATGSLGTGSYCCRLPQVPKKGKSVTIVNNDGIDLLVFPGTSSGDINGNIDGYFTVPSDGNSYVFNCYENPLPGGWSVINIPNGNTAYNTGIITYNATSSGVLSFINQSIKVITPGVGGGNVFVSSNVVEVGIISPPGGQPSNAYYLPTNPWKKINSISILTNVPESFKYYSSLTLSLQATLAIKFGGTMVDGVGNGVFYDMSVINSMVLAWSQANLGNDFAYGNWSGGSQLVHQFDGGTLGTFTSASLNNPNISAGGVGAPGTMKMTWNINPYMNGVSISRMIGKFYIGSILGTYNGASQLYDIYWFHSFSPSINILGTYNGNFSTNINNVKFRMILNVTPN